MVLSDRTFDVTKGIHLKPKELSAILDDPNTIVVDFLGNHETQVGHFKRHHSRCRNVPRIICPSSTNNSKTLKKPKLGHVCVPGIRCEKSFGLQTPRIQNDLPTPGQLLSIMPNKFRKRRFGKQIHRKRISCLTTA
jgi:hypothetical protein